MFTGAVGSGIFVLPYVFAHSNFLFASIFLIFLAFVTAALNHFYVDIVQNTKGDHQLSGYAQIYLGPRFKLLATLNLILLAFGAILAYSKLFQIFFALLFPNYVFISAFVYLIILFITLRSTTYDLPSTIYHLPSVFILLLPIILFIFSLTNYGLRVTYYELPNFMFYSPLLFALSGFTIIPEVRQTLGTDRKFPLAVILGLLLTALIYFLYAFSLVRLCGPNLTIDSVSGLAVDYPLLAKLLAIFGLFVTAKASSNFLIILHELFYRDLNVNKILSNFLPLLFPIIAVSLTTISLITTISLTGKITIYISAFLICLIRFRLPMTFTTQFLAILIFISLTVGLWF